MCVLVGEVFNCVAQEFQCTATFRRVQAADERPRQSGRGYWPGRHRPVEKRIVVLRALRGWGATNFEHDSTSWRTYRPKGETPESPCVKIKTVDCSFITTAQQRENRPNLTLGRRKLTVETEPQVGSRV